jgi:hypothetical protein
MPSFQISGRGAATGRKRKRVVRAIDRSTALAILEAEGTLVDECVELPLPAASREVLDHVASLGVTLPAAPSRPECVFEVLRWCILNRKVASFVYLTDVEGHPWRARVEPHGFRRSKEGYRLRCYVPAQQGESDVVADFQTEGWHLYLVEDIDGIEASQTTFEQRAYTRSDDEVAITISFVAE